MAISSETYNKDLYSLLKTKGYRPVPLDFKGEKTDPEQAVVFEFQFKKDGERYGVSYVTVDNNVTVYYDDEQTDSPSSPTKDLDYDDTWSGFLQQMKHWAMNKQLGFDLSNKDRLGDDLAQRKYVMDKEKINEGYYPMGKQASYSDAIPTVKIILQHTRQIQEGEQRYRNVSKIFLENQLGERILAPTVRPGIAQVYARHLAEGGVPNDERWNHIKGLCEEYSKMAGFVRAVKNNQFNESAQQLVNEGVNHYTSLRETLSRMRGQRGYNTYFESWTPTLMEDESEDNTINELFVQETLDPRIESVLPILSKLRKSVVEMKEVDELAEWADNLTEAPGAMTLKHNQNTEKSNLKAFDLEEDDVQDELKAADKARQKMKLPPSMRPPLSMGDIEASKKHPSSSGVVGRLADEPKKKLEEKDVEDTDIEMKLTQLTKAPDMFDAIYDALTGDDDLGKYLQDMYIDIARESRLHPDDDFEDIITRMADQLEDYYGKQGVAEGVGGWSGPLYDPALQGNGKKQRYEMMFKNGKVKRFSAMNDNEARKIAAGHGAKSVIKMKGNVPGDKIAEQGVAEGTGDKTAQQRKTERDKQRTAPAQKARNQAQQKGLQQDKDGTYYAKEGVAEGTGGNWYIRVNGKILNDTKFMPVIFSSEDEARSHAMKLADKKRIPLSQIKLTKSWMDAPGQGVAEGWNDRLDDPDDYEGHLERLRDLADLKRMQDRENREEPTNKEDNSKKKVDEINDLDKMFSLGGELPSTDRLDKDTQPDLQTDKFKLNTIKHLLKTNPSLSPDVLKTKTTPDLIKMLRDTLSEMDSQGYKGHRGDEDPGEGPEKIVKPAKPKDVAKDAEEELTKAMDKAHTKDVAEAKVLQFPQQSPLDRNVIVQLKSLAKTRLELSWEGPDVPKLWQGQAAQMSKQELARLSQNVDKQLKALGYEWSENEEDFDTLYLHSIAREKWYDSGKPMSKYRGLPDLMYNADTNTLSEYDLIGDEDSEYNSPKQFEGMSEDLDANQKRVGQLGPTEKVKNNNIGKLVGASESIEAKLKAITEMDKSQPSSDRGGESSGDPYAKGGKAKPVKAKDAAKDAEKVLDKAMDKAHKKDVKEGQEDLDAILRIIRK